MHFRPGNRATLGLLRTYFYYCRIVGLVPVIPYSPKNYLVAVLQYTTIIKIGAQRVQRSLFAQPNAFRHGLRTPNEAFFHWNFELLGLGRRIGQISSGVFSAKLSTLILAQWVPCPYFPQRIRDSAFVCP